MKHAPGTRLPHKCVRGRGCPGPADAAHETKQELYIGDVAASTKPLALHTLLGSCVAVCLHDSRLGIGGMNHILLPGGSHQDRSTRFGVHAMELLVETLLKIGADRRRLVAKAFGGANVLPCFHAPTIGDHNVSFVRQYLAAERIPLIAQRLGEAMQCGSTFAPIRAGRPCIRSTASVFQRSSRENLPTAPRMWLNGSLPTRRSSTKW